MSNAGENSRFDKFRLWLLCRPQADIVAVVMLLLSSAIFVVLTWKRSPIGVDRAWFMQVAARVTTGDVLYRDVGWGYPPLSIYLLSWLYRLFGIDVNLSIILGQILATIACLLTYRVARFILDPLMALLSTLAVFLSGWEWYYGGFLSYIMPYTGAVSVGAVMGLLFVFCLLSFFQTNHWFWLICAGFTTAGCCLSKPEFALASMGTGVFFLILNIFIPNHCDVRHWRGWPLGVYILSTVAAIGLGYAPLVRRAGLEHVWLGISGYSQAKTLLLTWPPWGTAHSWPYIFGGLGIYLMIVALLVGLQALQSKYRFAPRVCGLAVLGFMTIGAVWLVLSLFSPNWIPPVLHLRKDLISRALLFSHASGTFLLCFLVLILCIRWFRCRCSQQRIKKTEWLYAVLVLYSILAAARFYFNSAGALTMHYWNTLSPVLVFSAVVLLPRALARWKIPVHSFVLRFGLSAILCAYAATGLFMDVKYLPRLKVELVTPRGTVFTARRFMRWSEALDYILAHTEPEDSIVVLGSPELTFLSGRRNPLKLDYYNFYKACIPPKIESEMMQELQACTPKFVFFLFCPVEKVGNVAESLESCQDFLACNAPTLVPVFQYLNDDLEIKTVLSHTIIYEPRLEP
ncbi:MAG: hypothetical protein JXA37_02565 [Chloroflexia bacterium]|nr:hypothetical protein [Chloroflexia bacterium]